MEKPVVFSVATIVDQEILQVTLQILSDAIQAGDGFAEFRERAQQALDAKSTAATRGAV